MPDPTLPDEELDRLEREFRATGKLPPGVSSAQPNGGGFELGVGLDTEPASHETCVRPNPDEKSDRKWGLMPLM